MCCCRRTTSRRRIWRRRPARSLGENGNLVAVGPPLINPNPSLADPNPPLPPWMSPAAAGAGNGQSGVGADTASAGAAVTAGAGGPEAMAGSHGSELEGQHHRHRLRCLPRPRPRRTAGTWGRLAAHRSGAQLGLLTGQPATSATQLLLGPVARGTTVSVVQEAAMKYRGASSGCRIFMVVAVALTWLVYVTLRRDVAGQDGSLRGGVHRCVRPARG